MGHQLAVSLSSIRALAIGNLDKAEPLRNAVPLVAEVNLRGTWRISTQYKRILDHIVELSNVSVKERVQELKRVRGSLPEHIIEQRENNISRTFLGSNII